MKMEEDFERIDRDNSWGIIYQFIRYKSRNYHLLHKEARKPANVYFNRYKDVYPYDHSRVILHRGKTDYINASFVSVPEAKRAYILTQGPLPNTTSHFWAMVWEQKSKAVIMLNRIVEKNIVKCHQYWPSDTLGDEDEFIFNDVNLKVTNQSEEVTYDYIIRELLLTDLETKESRTIYHFHYVTWPDFGVPESPGSFLQFLDVVREKGVLGNDFGPPIIHCSAGIGRSGTFCLVDSCLVLIEETRKGMDVMTIKDLLVEMRRYRMGLIQTPDQLRFSCLAIIEGAKEILIDNESSLPKEGKEENFEEKLHIDYASDEAESSEQTSEELVSDEDDDDDDDLTLSEDGSIPEEFHDREVANDSPEENSTGIRVSNESSEIETCKDTIEIKGDVNETPVRKSVERESQSGSEACKMVETQLTNELCEENKEKDSEICVTPIPVEMDSECLANRFNEVSESTTTEIKAILPEDAISENSIISSKVCREQKEMSNELDKNDSEGSKDKVTILNNKNEGTEMCSSNDHSNKDKFEMKPPMISVLKEDTSVTEELLEEKSLNCNNVSANEVNSNMSNFNMSDRTEEELIDAENEHIDSQMFSRHLEFYQSSDASSFKPNTQNPPEQKNEQSQFCGNSTSQNVQRSLSCPRQLPSISSELLDSVVNGKLQKRRNSAEAGVSSTPLNLTKKQKTHNNSEYETIQEIEKYVEGVRDPEVKPKESFTRLLIKQILLALALILGTGILSYINWEIKYNCRF